MPATGTESASAQMQGAPESKARLAVFDFDGTSIAGNSPVLLVSHLLSRKML